jgi:DNA processing protein
MDERSAYLAFNLTAGIGPNRLRALIDYCGSAPAAWQASADDWRAAGLDRRSIEALHKAHDRLDLAAEWRAIEAAGLQVILLNDASYPPLLRQIEAPPPLLYVRGTLVDTDRWAVAVVGTRNATPYGREVTYKIAGDLASAGVTVVSGLALGIDAIAHRAALDRSGRTLAVLGSGLGTIYPPQHRGLADEIAGQGALISEYAPTSAPLGGNVPARNRLISGLALGTLVVEAGERSGALITVQFALEQGREVFAIPGSILSRASDGPNQLIVDGATPIRSVEQLLAQLNLNQAVAQQAIAAIVPDTPTEAALLPLLSGEPTHIDVLGRSSGLGAAEIAATLGLMELKGMVRQIGGMQYVLAREAAAPYTVSQD